MKHSIEKYIRFRVRAFLLFVFILSLVPSFPRLTEATDMGFHFGLISNSAGITPEAASEGKSGLGLGILFEFPAGNGFAFQPEFNFVSRGFTFAVNSVDLDFSLSYFEFPLYFKIDLTDFGGAKLSALFGPTIGLRIGAGCDLSEGSTASSSACESSGVPEFATFNLAFDLGLSLKVPAFSNVALLFDIRYSIGASDVYSATDSTNLDITLSAFEFWLGFSWPM